MNDINYSFNCEEEKIEVIISLLLNDAINKVLLMRKEHLAKLNRERVRRYRQRKREIDTSEYMRRVREQKQQYRQVRRLNHVNNGQTL
jgi:hypothetical protein